MGCVTWTDFVRLNEVPVTIYEPTYENPELITYLHNQTPDGSVSDSFGGGNGLKPISVSGTLAIVGAINEDIDGSNNGIAYVFDITTGDLVSTLHNPLAGDSTSDNFGYSVAISGNYAVVGSIGEDADGNANGMAYVFNATTGSLLRTLHNPLAPDWDADYFGWSIDIDGDYVVVGALYEDADGTDNGAAYVFHAGSGNLISTLHNPTRGGGTGDIFGSAVAIDGQFVVVGAPYEDINGSNNGIAYVFDALSGNLVSTIYNPLASGSTLDYFGYSVDISGNLVVVGSYREDANGSDNGKAFVFNRDTGALLSTLTNPAAGDSTSDNFGKSVSISGEFVVVGSPTEDFDVGSNNGIAYIYNALTGEGIQTLYNPLSSGGTADTFGFAVSIDGEYIIVSSPGEDADGGNSGMVYVFRG